MDMRLSLIILTILHYIQSAEDRCRSYVCSALTEPNCVQEVIGTDGNYNFTMQDCKDMKKQYCPWTSLKPNVNDTLTCKDIPVPKTQK